MSEHLRDLFAGLQKKLENETDPLRREYLKGFLGGIAITLQIYDKELLRELLRE
jgi:hypothetical protein